MITFVINLHPGIPSMALAEPFLYPLQKEGKLNLIFPAVNNIADRMQYASMELSKHLERSAYTKYQVVFLVAIHAQQLSPFQDSLSAQMLLIRKQFLASNWLHQQPNKCYIIALDEVNEDEAIPAINVSTVYRDSWELDTKGYIDNEERFFVKLRDIAALDRIWKGQVHVDRSTIVNLGFARLPQAIQEQVMGAVKAITDRVNILLDASTINFDDYAVTPTLNYIDEQLLDKIKLSFFQRLGSTKNDPSRYSLFSPAEALRTSIAEQLGIFSQDNQSTFKLIRLPWQYSHEDILQQHLIKLSFAISLIANQEDIIESLGGRNYLLSMSLNKETLQQLLQTYFEHLHNIENRFTNRLNNPPPVSVDLLEDQDCACNENLDRKQPSLIQFNFLRYNGDLVRWNEWNDGLQEQITNYERQSKRKMQLCVDKGHRKEAAVKKVSIKHIDNKVEDLQHLKTHLQEGINHDFLSSQYAYDWSTFQETQTRALKPLLFSRPSNNELVLMVFLASLLLTLSFANTQFLGDGLEYHSAWYGLFMLLSCLVCLVALFLAKRFHQKNLHEVTMHVFDRARNIRAGISKNFERQKSYLQALCKLGIVRYNYEQALATKNEHSAQNLRIDFHRRKLAEHKKLAQEILRIIRTNTRSNTSQFNTDYTEPDINKPTYENDIYAPTSFLVPVHKNAPSMAGIENTDYKIQLALSQLIADMQFDKDRIYAKNS